MKKEKKKEQQKTVPSDKYSYGFEKDGKKTVYFTHRTHKYVHKKCLN